MKSLSWKQIAIALMAVALVTAGIFYFNQSTLRSSRSNSVNSAFAEYISSYTTGVIASGSVVSIVFTRDMIDSMHAGQESIEKLFEFSPSISGKTVWLDKRTVEFRPEDRMTPGEVYHAKFFLSRIANELPDDLRTFEYSFQVIPQNFEVVIVNTKAYTTTALQNGKIEGIINTADYAQAERVEESMEAVQEGKKLDLTWTHAADGRQHLFVVEEVVRKEKTGKVDISVNGSPIGIDRSQNLQVEIPSITDFRLMRAWVVQSPTQHVVLQFSDPIKEKQNLHGLITIADLPSLDYDIHENEIRVYPPVRQDGTKSISLATGIRSAQNKKLLQSVRKEIVFEQVKPAVRFAGKGTILPATHGLVVPFEAVNLNAVDVQVIKVFEKNVLQFFQVNNHEGNNELRRVGKKILQRKIALENTGITDPGKWTRYTLDIAKLIQSEPGAIYEIKLSFKQAYSTYACQTPMKTEEVSSAFDVLDEHEDAGEEGYYYDYYDEYYYGQDFDWRQRDNPCHSSYFTSNRAVSKNILASDLGITVKRGEDGQTLAFVTDLITAKPIKGVNIRLYSFQLQQIGQASTDNDGKIVISSKETPFAIVAENGSQRGYMRLVNGEALLVSNFNVSGDIIQKGLKGFLYGERGVWRPGDSLYLTFVLEDKRDLLPKNHPVVFELSNPQGQVMNRIVRSVSENGFYRFATVTAADAPTGNWTGRVKVGGTEFKETLKIETVKPNRLKINLDFGTDKFTSPDVHGKLEVKWLHGAPGRNLKAEFDVLLVKQPTVFENFSGYNFDDPSRQFESESQPLFEGTTDAEGKANVNATLAQSGAPSGSLNAVFRGKVYEESGNFSIDRFSIPYAPYTTFVGIRLPEGERYSGILYTDTNHKVAVATVDAGGKAVSRTGLEANMYKLDWRWWWENTNESLGNFIEGSYSTLVKSEKINTVNGKGQFMFNLQAAEYGRYFLRVCDPESGHCAGQIVYVDEPGWYSRARSADARGGANLLSFSTDKTKYNIGEKIQVTIPGSSQGRALVSVENGSKVLESRWVETKQGDTRFSIDAVADMSPNLYIHVSLFQPHGQTLNDMPIRLYGVVGVEVEDPDTHLEPVLTMPDVLVPGEEVKINVAEKTNRKMTFTLAVVDEGLLDLTRFKTPDAWRVFYAKEALGVRTWDLYDQVMGAFGANLERFISIGGDDAIAPGEVDPLANRFKPVVKFFGPYTVDGGSREITFPVPQYIGSVKTMVVAGYEGAYGKTEKVSAVRKPLMVLATLPRVLGPGEIVKLPVTLFTGDKGLDIKVEVIAKGPLSLSGGRTKSINLAKHSDTTVDFDLSVLAATGIGTVEVKATSGGLTATDVIEIQIRNPNLPVTQVDEFLLREKETWSTTYTPFGLTGTNSATLEISSMPPVNLGSRMRYLLQYPHGCIEQTTSSVFPQLYLDQVKALNQIEKDAIQKNVKAGIERLRSFVQADGGFGYWPGVSESTDSWGTSYAGHFLVEAEKKGYFVPSDLINRWRNFQRTRAAEWQRNTHFPNSDLLQAYRLYTLALAGTPDLGSMNRLREEEGLTSTAAWMLASAYAASGQVEAARKLVEKLPVSVKPYRELGYTYGSDLRDKALILETLILLGESAKAFEVLKEISAALGNNGTWMSTQETAMCLRAVASFSSQHKKGELKFSYKIGTGKRVATSTALPLAQIEVPVSELNGNTIEVGNESQGVLFTRLIKTGTPARGQEDDASHHLVLNVSYTDGAGNAIDPTRLEQGTEFVVEVKVAHPGLRGSYENLALSQVFPSGWEITNLRLAEADEFLTTSPFRYQDIRDDRVFTYFDLAPNEERTFRLLVTATYAGAYYLPATSCEAMYDRSIYARKKGQPVFVDKR